jgi:hypothetical protein
MLARYKLTICRAQIDQQKWVFARAKPRLPRSLANSGWESTLCKALANAALSPAGTCKPPLDTTSDNAPPSLDTKGIPAAMASTAGKPKPS